MLPLWLRLISRCVQGLLSAVAGLSYRRHILEPGVCVCVCHSESKLGFECVCCRLDVCRQHVRRCRHAACVSGPGAHQRRLLQKQGTRGFHTVIELGSVCVSLLRDSDKHNRRTWPLPLAFVRGNRVHQHSFILLSLVHLHLEPMDFDSNIAVATPAHRGNEPVCHRGADLCGCQRQQAQAAHIARLEGVVVRDAPAMPRGAHTRHMRVQTHTLRDLRCGDSCVPLHDTHGCGEMTTVTNINHNRNANANTLVKTNTDTHTDPVCG